MKNIDLATIKLDFDALADYWWTDDNGESFPILCCLNLYEACGLLPYIEAHAADHPGFQVVPLDNIQANVNTIEKIRSIIEHSWKIYKLDIDSDRHIIWRDPSDKKPYNYERDMTATAAASVKSDFLNYCPGMDDELEDDILVFRIWEKEEASPEEEAVESEEAI